MAQVLKEAVQQRIARAAVRVFARQGFRKATMAGIARAARVSTGNIYHYYGNKNELFEAVVGERFARRFTGLVRKRIRALEGVRDVRDLDARAPYTVASENLLAFAIEDRLRIVVLLGRAEGTPYEGFGERLVQDMQRRALAYARRRRPRFEATPALGFTLDLIYRNWLRTLVTILERFETEAEIRAAVAAFSTYHLAGLRRLLE